MPSYYYSDNEPSFLPWRFVENLETMGKNVAAAKLVKEVGRKMSTGNWGITYTHSSRGLHIILMSGTPTLCQQDWQLTWRKKTSFMDYCTRTDIRENDVVVDQVVHRCNYSKEHGPISRAIFTFSASLFETLLDKKNLSSERQSEMSKASSKVIVNSSSRPFRKCIHKLYLNPQKRRTICCHERFFRTFQICALANDIALA